MTSTPHKKRPLSKRKAIELTLPRSQRDFLADVVKTRPEVREYLVSILQERPELRELLRNVLNRNRSRKRGPALSELIVKGLVEEYRSRQPEAAGECKEALPYVFRLELKRLRHLI